jgi:hypothetical protein
VGCAGRPQQPEREPTSTRYCALYANKPTMRTHAPTYTCTYVLAQLRICIVRSEALPWEHSGMAASKRVLMVSWIIKQPLWVINQRRRQLAEEAVHAAQRTEPACRCGLCLSQKGHIRRSCNKSCIRTQIRTYIRSAQIRCSKIRVSPTAATKVNCGYVTQSNRRQRHKRTTPGR